MKIKIRISVLLLFLMFVWFVPGCYVGSLSQDNTAGYNSTLPDNNSDYPEYNVDDLNQYGEWISVSSYGRVWCPSVVNNWQPFTNGHWTWDGNDWVWVSYEPFGWIVYHYGSWDYSSDYGWFWIPGSEEWTPACVQWIDYGDYVGWAPRRPHNENWNEPWQDNNVHHWMVVRKGDFNRENVNNYRITAINRVDNVSQNPIQRRQPDVNTIQRYVKDPIGVVKFEKEPVVTRTTPVKNNNNVPDRTVKPPEGTPTLPVRNDNNPPERTSTPPVRNDNPPIRTSTPPSRNDTPTLRTNTTAVAKTPGNRQIIRMQVPPKEKQKVDRYSPKVQKDVLVKKNPKNQIK